MQKVYLLLRNNKQEGPFDLQELLQLPVQPTDLIWVEGRSAAWSYPTEIRELKPYFSKVQKEPVSSQPNIKNESTNTTQSNLGRAEIKEKKVFVSLPQQPITSLAQKEPSPEEALESKAEALRQKIQAYEATHPSQEPDLIETKLQRSMDDVAGEYANWAIRSKAKKREQVPKKLLLAGIAIAITTTLALLFFQNKNQEQPNTVLPSVAIQQEDKNDGVQNLAITDDSSIPPIQTQTTIENERQQKSNKTAPITANAKTENNTPIVESTSTVAEPILESDIPVENKGEADSPVSIEDKKKKSIGEALDGFFDKFKSKNKETDKAPATTATERRATKRGDASTEQPQMVDVSQQVKISSNKPTENWMLGVRGQKLTLQNRSAVVIKNAVVEVQYFGEDETLLDKKTIEFTNIKPNQKSTQAIPDHRLASHTSHKILSATGVTDPVN